jgi:MoxR-like ATPase
VVALNPERTPMKTNLLRAALFTPYSKGRWGLPVLAWSNPGEAKTSVVEELCGSLGLPCVTLSPGEMGEGAFGVIPVPDGKVIRYPAPEWVEQMADGGVVFIDEMSSTPPALQPPLLGLLFSRRIGGTVLNGRVRVVGAANPPEIAASGFELAAPVANRCGHINWSSPTIEEHTAYMTRASTGAREVEGLKVDARAEEARVLKAWPEAWAKAVGLETAFLARRPNLKNQCPKAGAPQAGRAWPSDRSWEHACRAFASAQVNGLTETERDEFIAGFIGEAVASEWLSFITEADLPDPAAFLDGRERYTHSPSRVDRTAAVLNACVALVTPAGADKRNDRADALWVFIESLVNNKADIDIVVPASVSLIEANLIRPAARGVMGKIQPVLKGANVRPGR